MALRSNHPRLASMSRITLLDGHYGKQTGIPFRRTPNADDVRHARSVQFLPNHGRPPEALIEGRFRWGPARWGTCHDRIIAKINSVHAYDRLFSHRASIIAGPFAKRPLRFPIRRQTFSLDNHFCVSRNRKTAALQTNHVEGLAAKTSRKVVFRQAIRNLKGRGHENQRVIADGDGHRKRLVPSEALFHLNPSMPPRRHIEPEVLAVMNHDSVGSDIDPSFFRITRHCDMPRADITAAVADVVVRRWKAQHIDIFFLPNIFHERAVFDFARRNGLHFLDPFSPRADEFHRRKIQRHSGCQSHSFYRVEQPYGEAITFGIAFNIVE